MKKQKIFNFLLVLAMFAAVTALTAFFAGCSQATSLTQEGSTIEKVRSIEGKKTTVCLVGDSRVEMMPSDLFAEDFTVFNYGVGGTTSLFSAQVLQNLYLSGYHYDAIVISVGVNDYSSGFTNTQSINSLSACVAWAKQISNSVYITTIPGCRVSSIFTPQNASAISVNAYYLSAYIQNIAAMNNVQVIPLASIMNSGMALNSIYDDGSGIHYNASGYQALYNLYIDYIQ